MKPIRLIAMDMDGTLLNSSQQLSAVNVSALHQAESKGVKLAICSGRAPGDNALFALENGLEHCAILALNGAYCLSAPNEPAYADHLMDGAAARQCIAWLKEADITFGCFLQNQIAVFESSHYDSSLFWGSYRDVPGAPEYIGCGAAFERAMEHGLNKIVLTEPDPAKLAAMKQRLLTLSQVSITSSWVENLELMPKKVHKGYAVKELAEKLGIEADQVMALGDFDNDLTMLAYAGYSVAMGNAVPTVKAAAKYQTLTNDEDGVAAAIQRFVLA